MFDPPGRRRLLKGGGKLGAENGDSDYPSAASLALADRMLELGGNAASNGSHPIDL